MKKNFFLTLCMLLGLAQTPVNARVNYRTPVAVMTKTGVLVSWRSFNTDGGMTFDVKRNGTVIASNISSKTNYLDADGKAGDVYTIVPSSGAETTATAWSSMYTSIDVPRPAAIKSGNTTGRYRPDDMTVADVDGDGRQELILKWMPDNQRDNGSNGYSSPCIIDCYKVDLANNTDVSKMWRINLGLNIRSGNHYTQFVVCDFDGDGKAELMCKTAPGSMDGKGNYVSLAATDATIKSIDNTKTYVNSNGHVNGGEELLTVFNGETGAAMHTVWYNPNRAMSVGNANMTYGSWGDSNQNRGNRHNACAAYLDGVGHNPTALFQRGYYTAQFMWAVDWDGTALKTRWLHRGTTSNSWNVVDANGSQISSGSGKSSYGQGVHGLSVGDVDNDGKQEICIGSATIDHDGKLLCSTGFGHGDAIHMGKLVSGRSGMQIMMPHEESAGGYGYDVHDAATGEILARATGTTDNGRGMACDFIPSNPGSEFWSSFDNNTYNCANNNLVLDKKADTNFRIYWSGDPYDQTWDGRSTETAKGSGKYTYNPRIRAYDTAKGNIVTTLEFGKYGNPDACNTTKATPCLQADFLGDWREEFILFEHEEDWSNPTCKLLIYSTPEPTEYKVNWLMEDPSYEMAIVWQNSSYNQPPHLSYDLAASLGINGATYKTKTTSNAPEAVEPPAPTSGKETVAAPANDKEPVTGICYTTGKNQEYTNSASSGYIKVRTNNNGETITYYVNEGYTITGMTIEGYSNNTSKVADRSITMTKVTVDGTEISNSTLKFPGGTAGQTPVTKSFTGWEAVESIVLSFDNSLICTLPSDDPNYDSAGKNKQLFATVTFTYKQATTGIEKTETVMVAPDGRMYNLAGQEIKQPVSGQIYIKNGVKRIAR